MKRSSNRITLAKGESARDALQRWYYNPTPAEEREGNIPSVNFEYVRCIECSPQHQQQQQQQVDVRTLHPQRDALILLYTLRKAYGGELCVLAAIPYHVMRFRLRGIVTTQDMAICGCLRITPLLDVRMYVEAPTPPWKWGIMLGDEVEITLNAMGTADIRTLMGEFCDRLQWYYSASSSSIPARSAHEKHLWIICSVFAGALEYHPELACHPQPHLDSRAARVHYEETRLEKERIRFMNHMSDYQRHSESTLLHLLYHNGLAHAVDPQMGDWNVVAPTTLDEQAFSAMYPDACYTPRIYFEVNAWEIPLELVSSRMLPLYLGGKVHLPCHWQAVSCWLWQLHVTHVQHHYAWLTRERFVQFLKDFPQLESVFEDASRVIRFRYFKTSGFTRGQGSATTSAASSRRISGKVNAVVDVGDVEDLWRIMPPCVRALREKGFPRHRDRMDLTPILKNGGITQQGAEMLYEHLNEMHPRDGLSLHGRYGLQYDWDRPRDSVFCGALIQKALRGEEAELLICPFAVDALRETGVENRVENRRFINSACYCACAASYNPPLQGAYFQRPADLIAILGAAAASVKTPTEAIIDEDALFSSTSSSSDDDDDER